MLAPPEPSRASPRPLVLWTALIVLGYGLDILFALPFVPLRFPPIATGGVFILIGFGIVGLALHEMRDFNAPSEETGLSIPTLVTGGVYRYSRNPLYIGLGVALFGFAVAINSLWVLAGLIPFFWFLATRVIPREEAELMRTYGELYDEYSKDVRRWL
jgi:protein-S-isoprenylcysteine O-methyltransferase Ste14